MDTEKELPDGCVAYTNLIRNSINKIGQSFLKVGYYLKEIRDHEYYKSRYRTIWEYAQAELGMSKSNAWKFMAINDRFSQGGNSKDFLPQYRDFSVSQLAEMMYLTDEQCEDITVATTVAEIREIKSVSTSKQNDCDNRCFICEEECNMRPKDREHCIYYDNSPCTLKAAVKTMAAIEPELYDRCNKTCCFNCDYESQCGYRCNPSGMKRTIDSISEFDRNKENVSETEKNKDIVSTQEETVSTSKQEEPTPTINEADNVVPETPDIKVAAEPTPEKVVAEIVQKTSSIPSYDYDAISKYTEADVQGRLYSEQYEKEKYIKSRLNAPLLKSNRLKIDAFNLLLEHMKTHPNHIQPLFPVLKNQKEREEWIKNYRSWGIWYQDKEINCQRYKYDFEDGSRIIVDEYLTYSYSLKEYIYDKSYSHMHLVKAGEHYKPYSTSMSEVIEFLKKIKMGVK